MYGIFPYINHKHLPNVGKNASPIECLGKAVAGGFRWTSGVGFSEVIIQLSWRGSSCTRVRSIQRRRRFYKQVEDFFWDIHILPTWSFQLQKNNSRFGFLSVLGVLFFLRFLACFCGQLLGFCGRFAGF